MASRLHRSARTTPRVQAELQASEEPARALAARYGLNPQTVAKWRRRGSTDDLPMGPRRPRSTVRTKAEEAAVVEFRRRTLLSLDDVLGRLRQGVPRLSRSALHRCLARHGISRRPKGPGDEPGRRRLAETAVGFVHIDSCQLRSAEGRAHHSLAVDRVSKLTYVEFHPAATMATGAAFMRGVVAASPYRLRVVLTDNGVAFTNCASTKWDWMVRPFDRVCHEPGIEHRRTRPYHPWTNRRSVNGQADRMVRTIKETAEALWAHVLAFVAAYNFARHPKVLRWRTPWEAVRDAWARDPAPFKVDPHHLVPGPYT